MRDYDDDINERSSEPKSRAIREELGKRPVPIFEKPDDEITAANHLRMARELYQIGRISAATRHFKTILEEYPGTKVAPAAKAELDSMSIPDLPDHEFRAEVVAVADGDTIVVQGSNSSRHFVQLREIDAPEIAQPYGPESKQHLTEKVLHKRVLVRWDTRDDGRLLGIVRLDYRDVNLEMLRDGMAWHYKEFTNSEDFARAEARARGARIGLWADADAEPPWKFRMQDRGRE
jgi:endonuclease YncB( thermonuclease family)